MPRAPQSPPALVRFTGAGSVGFQPDRGLTGSDGQFTTNVSLGSVAGQYQIVASTTDSSGKRAEVRIEEIALGYQELLGQQLNQVHCIAATIPNPPRSECPIMINLTGQGPCVYGRSSPEPDERCEPGRHDQPCGAALNKSAEMPPYGNRLTKVEIDALTAFIRAVADPPYRPQGVFDASN